MRSIEDKKKLKEARHYTWLNHKENIRTAFLIILIAVMACMVLLLTGWLIERRFPYHGFNSVVGTVLYGIWSLTDMVWIGFLGVLANNKWTEWLRTSIAGDTHKECREYTIERQYRSCIWLCVSLLVIADIILASPSPWRLWEALTGAAWLALFAVRSFYNAWLDGVLHDGYTERRREKYELASKGTTTVEHPGRSWFEHEFNGLVYNISDVGDGSVTVNGRRYLFQTDEGFRLFWDTVSDINAIRSYDGSDQDHDIDSIGISDDGTRLLFSKEWKDKPVIAITVRDKNNNLIPIEGNLNVTISNLKKAA